MKFILVANSKEEKLNISFNRVDLHFRVLLMHSRYVHVHKYIPIRR